jgi:hypothetical protein
MKKYMVALPFLLLSVQLASAAQPLINTWSSKIVLFAGYRTSNFSTLNGELQSASLPAFSNPSVVLGLFSMVVLNDAFIFGFEGQTLLKQSASDDVYSSSLGSFSGFFNVGYQFLNAYGVNAYALVGGGFGTVQVKTYEKAGQTFAQVLADPQKGFEPLFCVSIGADYLFDLAEGKDRGGFLGGLRVGYVIDPFPGTWSMSSVGITDGIDVDLSGFYVSLMFGGGIQSYREN